MSLFVTPNNTTIIESQKGNNPIRGANVPVNPRKTDVLLGRGRTRWEGNLRFDMEIRKHAQRYQAAETKYEKTSIVRGIIQAVQKWGQFLDQKESERNSHYPTAADDLPPGDWYMASYVKIRKKVGQALRYQMDMVKYEGNFIGGNKQCLGQQKISMQNETCDVAGFGMYKLALKNGLQPLPEINRYDGIYDCNHDGPIPSTQPTANIQCQNLTPLHQPESQKNLAMFENISVEEEDSDCDCSICCQSSSSSNSSFNRSGENDILNINKDSSMDISLSALLALDQEESDARNICPPAAEVLVTDEEILEYLRCGNH